MSKLSRGKVYKVTICHTIWYCTQWHLGPTPCKSIDGYKYYATLIYVCTQFCWLFALYNKSYFYDVFVTFCAFVSTQLSTSMKTLQSDRGEYISHKLQTFLQSKGIVHNKSCLYTPKQNKLAKRKHRYVTETTVTLLQYAKLPFQIWTFACQAAIYLINRTPTPMLHNQSPFQALYRHKPVITHLRAFGCSCYPLLRS